MKLRNKPEKYTLGTKPPFQKESPLFSLHQHEDRVKIIQKQEKQPTEHEKTGSERIAQPTASKFSEKIKGPAKFLGYAIYGYTVGASFKYIFDNYGLVVGMAAAITVGVAPLIAGKLFKAQKGKMTTLLVADTVSGEFVYPTVITTVSILSRFVHGPLSGLMVGATAAFFGYLTGTLSFYGFWGANNLGKYRQTGFGSFKDLKQLPHHFMDAMKSITQTVLFERKEEQTEKPKGPVEAGTFLSEFAEMHGKGLACSSPYIALRIAAGFIAGFGPSVFLPTFISVFSTVAVYVFPFYATFYALVAERANSVVKTPRIAESMDQKSGEGSKHSGQ